MIPASTTEVRSPDFYVAIKPCGCMVWGVRDPKWAKLWAQPPNPRVEIKPVVYDDVKDHFVRCSHVEAPPAQGVLL